jgi:hypothetical protein
MKVRVLIQRASFARDSRFCSFSLLRFAEKIVDCIKYFVHVCKHLVVPESENPVVPRLQERSANFIFFRELGVLSAVQFNDEALFDRAEVCEIRPDRMLTSELHEPHPAASQMAPQDSFRVRLFMPQSASVPLRRLDDRHRVTVSHGGIKSKIRREQNLNRAQKSALYKDPHLRSSPILGEGKRKIRREQNLKSRAGDALHKDPHPSARSGQALPLSHSGRGEEGRYRLCEDPLAVRGEERP